MMKTKGDFNEVLFYTTYVGFKSKQEFETYLKNKGFGIKHQNFYTDNEENELAFKVEFYENQVATVEVVVFPFKFKMLKEFDFMCFC